MSDNHLGEKLVSQEESKGRGHDPEDDYTNDLEASAYVPNVNFEMNQKTLTSREINPKDLRAKVEEYLEEDGLTRDQVKLLLKQGAEDNYLFMIKEETYDKLVDALGMKLDHADDNNVGNITGLLATARLEYADGMSKSPNIRNLDSTASRFAQLMKSRVALKDKSAYGGKQNAAGVAKDLTFTQKTKAAINSPDDEEEEPLQPAKPLPPTGSAHAAQETSPYLMERVPRMTNQGLKNNLIIAGFIFISIICFITWGIVTYATRREVVRQIIGFPLLISRGGALAIMVLSIFLLLLVSYDFLTWIRPYWASNCLSLLDFNILFHKVCGYLILFYSTVHTISHLSFSVPAFSNPELSHLVEKYVDNWHFTYTPTYIELAVTTIPGITGVILELTIVTMYLTSLECVRRKCFQVFAYTHVILFPVFMFGMIAHGGARWINWNFPTAIVPLTIPLTIYFFMIFRRLVMMCRKPFFVADVSVVSTRNFIHINLVVPRGYTWKSGQYAFLNIPAINALQWHPFSIASSPNGNYLSFLIKRAGDWSGQLIDTFYDIKMESFKETVETLVDSKFDKEFREYLMQMQCEITDDIVRRNRVLFPKVYVSRSVSAPAEMAARRRRVIMIGAGSGIAPFLALLDDQQVASEGGRTKNGVLAASYKEEYKDTEKAHLILTSRDADQFSWLSPYIDRIMNADGLSDKVELHLYLTSTKCNTLPSFLFWRSFLLREQKKKQGLLHSANPIIGSKTHLNIGRPNFEKIIDDIHRKEPGDFFCYACAPTIIVNQAMAACNKISEEGKDTFLLRYEIF